MLTKIPVDVDERTL